jgi:hypothetical protein
MVWLGTAIHAAPQEAADPTAPSLTRIKQRLSHAPATPLKPSAPVQLRPVFRTRNADRPFVPTLEEHLRKTFDLTDFQRQYASYAAACCGVDLGALFRNVDRALDERRERKVREQVARELAFVEAAQGKQIR